MLCLPSPTEILILLKRFYCSCDSSSSASRRNTMSFNIPVHSPDSFTSGHLEQSCGDGFMTMIGNTLLQKSDSLETHQCAPHTFLLSHQAANHSQLKWVWSPDDDITLKPLFWLALFWMDKTRPFINPSPIHSAIFKVGLSQDRNHDQAVLRTQNSTSLAPTATHLCLLENVDVKKYYRLGRP